MNSILKYLACIICLVLTTATVSAQNLAFYFELIPDAQLPHLKSDMRKGMVGIYELGQRPAQVPNQLNGICVLDTLSNDYLSMHTSDISTMDIKMLAEDSTSVLAVVHTVKVLDTKESNISFFTNTWSKLNTEKYFVAPTAKDFYMENENISLQEFTSLCTPLLIIYNIEGDELKATIDPEKYLPVEVFKKISPALSNEPMRYNWNKKYER